MSIWCVPARCCASGAAGASETAATACRAGRRRRQSWGADARADHGLAAGGSLGQLVAGRGRLGPGETVTVLTPIAQALAYLHGQGFTHGDVSPGNVLFTAHGKPLLADLGVARMVADAAAVADAGTEGFRDPAPVDAVRAGLQPERDVYSLAALGWYCLTGRAPEPGAQRPPLPLLVPGVPAALAAALESGLQEDRRLRPSAAELAAAVHRSAVAVPVDLSVSVHPTGHPAAADPPLPAPHGAGAAGRDGSGPCRAASAGARVAWPARARKAPGRRPSRSRRAALAAPATAARARPPAGPPAARPPGRAVPSAHVRRGRPRDSGRAAGLAAAGRPRCRVGARRCAAAARPFPGFAGEDADGGEGARADVRPTAAAPGPTAMDAAAVPPGVQAQLASAGPRGSGPRTGLASLPGASARGTSGCWTRSTSRRRRRPWRTDTSAPALRNPAGCWPDSPPS